MKKLAVSVAEFGGAVGIGRTKAYKEISDNEVETFKIGRRTLVTVESIERYVARKLAARANH